MQESKISKYYSTFQPHPSTVTCIPNWYIIKHSKEYQAHLQSINDFIACGEGVWWQQILSGVEFSDGTNDANSRPQIKQPPIRGRVPTTVLGKVPE